MVRLDAEQAGDRKAVTCHRHHSDRRRRHLLRWPIGLWQASQPERQ